MKECILIGKLVGICPTEKALVWWINNTWKPQGHYDLQLREKGFFTVIFFNEEDRTIIFESGPYFFNSAGLFLRLRKERFNPKKENITIVPVWMRMYSFPTKYWSEEIITDIGNILGNFVKVLEQTRQRRYTSYAPICIYLDISKDLPNGIDLTWEDEDWFQAIDYEQIPFKCRRCHEHGNLFRDCP